VCLSAYSHAGTRHIVFCCGIKLQKLPFDGVINNATTARSSDWATTTSGAVFDMAAVKRVFHAVKMLLCLVVHSDVFSRTRL
jgi:hypothetical protein